VDECGSTDGTRRLRVLRTGSAGQMSVTGFNANGSCCRAGQRLSNTPTASGYGGKVWRIYEEPTVCLVHRPNHKQVKASLFAK
jgi:hypothetical protein